MKMNFVMLLIALAFAALSGYGFYVWNTSEPYQLLITIGAGVLIFITFGGIITIQSAGGRGSVANIRVLSIIFLIISIIGNIIFSIIPFSSPTSYILVNGIIFLLYFLIGYSVIRALK